MMELLYIVRQKYLQQKPKNWQSSALCIHAYYQSSTEEKQFHELNTTLKQ